jgi:hypothetical protein
VTGIDRQRREDPEPHQADGRPPRCRQCGEPDAQAADASAQAADASAQAGRHAERARAGSRGPGAREERRAVAGRVTGDGAGPGAERRPRRAQRTEAHAHDGQRRGAFGGRRSLVVP